MVAPFSFLCYNNVVMYEYAPVKRHDLTPVKDSTRNGFEFFYNINRNLSDGGDGVSGVLVSTAYMVVVGVDEKESPHSNWKFVEHGIFCVDFVRDGDERILTRDFGKDWKKIVNEHMERHLVEMACVLSENRLREQSVKDCRTAQFLMGFGYPFSVEESRTDEDGNSCPYVVTTHNHEPIGSFPCLAQAELVCDALNVYKQPYAF